MSATDTCYDLTLHSESSVNNSVTWSDFVIRLDSDGLIEYERMPSQGGIIEGLVGVSEFKILVEMENRKVLQPSGLPKNCNFYLY